MNPSSADVLTVDILLRYVPRRRAFILACAAVLAISGATPAIAEDESTGLQLARDFVSRAVELASNPAEVPETTVTVPADPPDDNGNPGDHGKGKGSDNGKGKGKGGDNGKGKGKSNPVNPGNSNRPEKLTGRDRAAEAIERALDRGNGNGNGFGRGHAADVIEELQGGESPATLTADENHGAEVSAMVAAYNVLKSQLGEDR